MKVELYSDPQTGKFYVESTVLGEDLEHKARVNAWRENALKNLAVGRDCGPYALASTMVNAYPGVRLLDGQSGCMSLGENYESAKLGPARADIYEVTGNPVTVQQLLGLVRGEECSVARTAAGRVVTAKRGNIFCWRSRGQMMVRLGGSSRRVQELLPLYAAKYPSDLPADVKTDWTAWAREEMESELAAMKKARESRSGEDARETLNRGIGNIVGFAYVPLVNGVGVRLKDQFFSSMAPDPSREQLEKQYDLLAAWWAEQKDRTYWHKGGRRLVAKGETPEELAAKRRAK